MIRSLLAVAVAALIQTSTAWCHDADGRLTLDLVLVLTVSIGLWQGAWTGFFAGAVGGLVLGLPGGLGVALALTYSIIGALSATAAGGSLSREVLAAGGLAAVATLTVATTTARLVGTSPLLNILPLTLQNAALVGVAAMARHHRHE